MNVHDFKMGAEVDRLQFILLTDVIDKNPNMKFIDKDDKGKVTFEFNDCAGKKHNICCTIRQSTNRNCACVKVMLHKVGMKTPSVTFILNTFSDYEIGIARHVMDSAPQQIINMIEKLG